MRIMATSDLHGNLNELDPKGADVVVLAGDIAPLKGRGVWHVNDQKKWINKKFREWTQSYPDPRRRGAQAAPGSVSGGEGLRGGQLRQRCARIDRLSDLCGAGLQGRGFRRM